MKILETNIDPPETSQAPDCEPSSLGFGNPVYGENARRLQRLEDAFEYQRRVQISSSLGRSAAWFNRDI